MIIEKIDELYKNGKNSKEWDGLHASSIGKCERELYYEAVLKKDKEIEPRVKRVFENGDSFHQRMMRTLYQVSDIRIVAGEIKMPVNGLVKGTCDAVVGIENENFIIDFKSINNTGFEMLDDAKLDHKMQVLVYMHFFNIEKALVIYENKDNQSLKEFLVVKVDNLDLLEHIMNKIEKLKIAIKNTQLPDKPSLPENEKWRCMYCSYRQECQQNINVEVKNGSS